MYIEVKNVSLDYRQKNHIFRALDDVSFNIDKGEFICILGPSGCGKTTLLSAMAGFTEVSSGTITIDGRLVKGPRVENIILFQNYGLLPWRNVRGNVALGLENNRVPKNEIPAIVDKYIRLVGLEDFATSHPHQLSGGMQQRVTLARALAVNPEIIFMDEPFGALDIITRANLQMELIRIWRVQQKTIVFVTHDIDEAVYLADKIVIMNSNPGRMKALVTVNLERNRDKTGKEFAHVRDNILEIFEMKVQNFVEYYL
ncbi:MAG: ABC transporter ATP-binding protein [Burkholderiales bacterium]|nr:ABC transporter ATP-binding protein [Burkholderiales bacterium]